MKNQNNSLETNTIFSKIKSWWYNLFHKSNGNSIEPQNVSQDTNNALNEEININKPKDFFEEYKEKNERREYLLNLQRKYKNKEILEEEMTEEDRTDLENLYMEQNMELKRKIRSFDSKIAKAQK